VADSRWSESPASSNAAISGSNPIATRRARRRAASIHSPSDGSSASSGAREPATTAGSSPSAFKPMPVSAAKTGAMPVSTPARAGPSAATVEYHSTNATTVTRTAR